MIDRVLIHVRAGKGGNGAVSFRREKYVPFGGPDGGDGGRGGNIYAEATSSMRTLREYRNRRFFKAENGGPGSGKNKHGRNGRDLTIRVPVGTIVRLPQGDEYEVLADLSMDGQKVLAVRGGLGGRGNARFATPWNQAPRIAEKGQPGEERLILLDLKLLADVGIVGYPSVGKSTLISVISAAKPKIAEYPFTTLEPVLGVVEVGNHSFVVADIPGIIEGAHLGKGLGLDFLRHIERTKVIVHLLDGTRQNLLEDYNKLNAELALYSQDLALKPQLVAVNKIDITEVRESIFRIQQQLSGIGSALYFISAATGEGIAELLNAISSKLGTLSAGEELAEKEAGYKLYKPAPRVEKPSIHKEGDIFVVSSDRLERIVAMTDLENIESKAYLFSRLRRISVAKALEKAGVKPGDKVRIGEIEIKWEL